MTGLMGSSKKCLKSDGVYRGMGAANYDVCDDGEILGCIRK